MEKSKLISKHVHEIYSDFIIKSSDFNNLYDKYQFSYNDIIKNASWRFENPDVHHIVIGDVIENEEDNEKQRLIVQNYVFHEMGHTIFTTRNMKNLLEKLKKNKINFTLYNLFEDARIEFQWAIKYRHHFSWYIYDKFNGAKSVDEIFFKIIHTGNRIKHFSSTEKPMYKKVFPYYKLAVNAKNDDEMIKIILQFKEVFHLDEMSSRISEVKYTAFEITDIEDMSFDGISLVPIEIESNIENILRIRHLKLNKNKIKENKGNYDYIQTTQLNKKDDNLVNEIVHIMKNIFKTTRFNTLSYRGKRINPSRMVLDSDKVFMQGNSTKNKKRTKITLTIDMSGSMEIIYYETINIIYAINVLASMGYLDVSLILSSTNGYQVIKLPCEESTINNISFNIEAAEGLAQTFRSTTELLKKSNNNIVITDGHIMDTIVNKDILHQLNIQTLAIYISKPFSKYQELFEQYGESITEEEFNEAWKVDEKHLLKYFDKIIVKNTVIEVIEEIVNQGFRL